MFPDRKGVFDAYPLEIGVDETGPNKLATVIIKYGLTAEHDGGEVRDIASEILEITGYHYLECKDSSLNTFQIHALKSAFGWDGTDPFWFETTDLSKKPVTLVLDWETCEGKDRLRIKYLNPHGQTGGGGTSITRADESTKRAMAGRLGSKLRAISGPPKPAARPTPPKPRPTPGPKSKPTGKTYDEVWAQYCQTTGYDAADAPRQEELAVQWWEAVGKVAGDTPTENLTPEQWAAIDDALTAALIPY